MPGTINVAESLGLQMMRDAGDEASPVSPPRSAPKVRARASLRLLRPRRRAAPPPAGPPGSRLHALAGGLSPAPPSPRTKWTRRVPHPVLIGHAASLTPYQSARATTRLLTDPRAPCQMLQHPDDVARFRAECGVGTKLGKVALPPPPSPRTKWTRRVPHPVPIGHAASLTPYQSARAPTRPCGSGTRLAALRTDWTRLLRAAY